jgi:hypothetical protein
MTSKAGVKGTLSWDLFGPSGELKVHGENHNLVVNEGLYWLADQALPTPTQAKMKQIVLGLSTVAPGSADTWVGTAYANNGGGAGTSGSVAAGTIAGTQNAFRFVGTFSAGYGSANGIAEAICTNGVPGTSGSDPGTSQILSRALISPTVNKGTADSLVVTWDISLAAV